MTIVRQSDSCNHIHHFTTADLYYWTCHSSSYYIENTENTENSQSLSHGPVYTLQSLSTSHELLID